MRIRVRSPTAEKMFLVFNLVECQRTKLERMILV